MKTINITWEDIISTSNKLVEVYSKESDELQLTVKDFAENLVSLSETFISDRESSLIFLKENHSKLYLQATNIMSNADSVAVIMQANEGINDYLILVNLFRNLLVILDTLSSTYWLKKSEDAILSNASSDKIKYLVNRSNKSCFQMDETELVEFISEGRKYKLIEDKYFSEIMNLELWKEVKLLEEKIFSKPDASFEYFKELLATTEHLADDMVISLWGVLAVAFSYLDYLTKLLGE